MADTTNDQNQRDNIETEFDLLPDSELTEKHWKILEAAVRVFSEKGFGASRTSEVAKEAGVSEGTIFNYFKTKKDLLVGLLIPLVTRFFRPLILSSLERILSTRKERSIEEVLHDVTLDRVQLIQKNLPLIKTVAAEAAFHPELIDPLREQVAPKVIETMSRYFQAEIDNGTFRDIDPKLLFRTFASMVGGYILTRNVLPAEYEDADEEAELKQMVDIFLNGVKKQ
ncbi:TetR family transcriptional regulator [Tumebacillus algifaecis]|uniref:TetR family transcriptional regulator n=1 Tax=Tumebacillus algifaecis TaxID=1214604 RepID=A0A223D4S7_9BACL|nr:TetR/AcrR family transcriptional regulator [Tumebacillus algifaecis]ASS76457.1 TetR family transcriptional regulator [Tumebacillus algifaecis]